MPPLEAPTVASLLTLAGNAAVVALLVTLIKRTADLTAAQVDRYGPAMAVGTGVVLAEIATLVTHAATIDANLVTQAALTGLVSGCLSSGLYDLVGDRVQSSLSAMTGGRVGPPSPPEV